MTESSIVRRHLEEFRAQNNESVSGYRGTAEVTQDIAQTVEQSGWRGSPENFIALLARVEPLMTKKINEFLSTPLARIIMSRQGMDRQMLQEDLEQEAYIQLLVGIDRYESDRTIETEDGDTIDASATFLTYYLEYRMKTVFSKFVRRYLTQKRNARVESLSTYGEDNLDVDASDAAMQQRLGTRYTGQRDIEDEHSFKQDERLEVLDQISMFEQAVVSYAKIPNESEGNMSRLRNIEVLCLRYDLGDGVMKKAVEALIEKELISHEEGESILIQVDQHIHALMGNGERSLQDVGEVMGVSRERIRQREKKILGYVTKYCDRKIRTEDIIVDPDKTKEHIEKATAAIQRVFDEKQRDHEREIQYMNRSQIESKSQQDKGRFIFEHRKEYMEEFHRLFNIFVDELDSPSLLISAAVWCDFNQFGDPLFSRVKGRFVEVVHSLKDAHEREQWEGYVDLLYPKPELQQVDSSQRKKAYEEVFAIGAVSARLTRIQNKFETIAGKYVDRRITG